MTLDPIKVLELLLKASPRIAAVVLAVLGLGIVYWFSGVVWRVNLNELGWHAGVVAIAYVVLAVAANMPTTFFASLHGQWAWRSSSGSSSA